MYYTIVGMLTQPQIQPPAPKKRAPRAKAKAKEVPHDVPTKEAVKTEKERLEEDKDDTMEFFER